VGLRLDHVAERKFLLPPELELRQSAGILNTLIMYKLLTTVGKLIATHPMASTTKAVASHSSSAIPPHRKNCMQ
jgi:hypothetical protein